MANKGLKEENTMLSFSISDINISIDLTEENENIIATIPLTIDKGPMPINVGVIYNDKNRDIESNFGKGFRFSEDKSISFIPSGGGYKIENSDGSDNIFTYYGPAEDGALYKDIYGNKLYDCSYDDYDQFKLEDKYNNFIRFLEDSSNQISVINHLGKYAYMYNYGGNYFELYNTYNDILRLENSNPLVDTLIDTYSYKENNTVIYSGSIAYDNSKRITGIVVTKNQKTIRDISIIYTTNNNIRTITFKNNITKEIIKIERKLSSNNQISIEVNEGYYDTNNVNYFLKTTIVNYISNYKTTVTNVDLVNSSNSLVTTYYFDKNSLLEQVVDSDYNVVSCSFNNEIKKLNYKTEKVHQKLDILTNPLELIQANFDYLTSTLLFNQVSVPQDDEEYLDYMYQNTNSGSICFYNNVLGIGSDSYGIALWVKNMSGTGTLKVELTLGTRKDTILLDETDIPSSYYKMLYLGATSYDSFDKVEFELIITGNLRIQFGRLEIINNNLKTKYEYVGTNLTETSYGTNTSHNMYSSANLINGSYGDEQTSSYYDYNSDNQQTKKYMPYGIKEEYSYSGYNLIKKELKDNNVSLWEENYSYTNSEMTSYVDIYNHTAYMNYLNHNITSNVDFMSNTTYYSYDCFDDITDIYLNNSYFQSIAYNQTDRTIDLVSSPGTTAYKYIYDNKKRISEIRLNNQTLESYTYNDNNLLTTLTRFSDTYSFTYDEKKRIHTISFNNILKFQFDYDDKSRIKEIKNGSNTTIRRYVYDDKDNLEQIVYPNEFEIDYLYHQNKQAYKIYNKNNSKVYLEEIGINNSISKNPLNLDNYIRTTNNLVGTTYNIDQDIRGSIGKVPAYILDDGATDEPITFKNTIKALRIDPERKHLYYSADIYQTVSEQPLGILLWFNVSNATSETCLFEIKKANNNNLNQRVYCYIHSGRIEIDIFSVYGVYKSQILVSDYVIEEDAWHYVGFSYEFDSTLNKAIYHLNVDGKYYELKKSDVDYQLGQISNAIYFIGYEVDSTGEAELLIPGYITAVSISNGRIVSKEDLEVYYKLSSEYIIKLDEVDETLNFNSIIEYKKDLLTNYDIIPLHSNVISLKGQRPIKYSYYKANSFVLDNFNYDNKLKTLSYTPSSGLLYDYNLSNSGTIYLEFNYQREKDKCYLINNVNNNINLSLIIKNKRLYIELIYGQEILEDLGIDVTLNVAHNICFTYYVDSNGLHVYIYYDNTYVYKLLGYTITLPSLLTSLGQRNDANEPCEFDGSIHMVVINNSYTNSTGYNNIKTNLLYYINTNRFDKYNHLIIKETTKNRTNIISNNYTYYKNRISSEDIVYGNTTKTRSYGYNNNQMVNSITDSFFGSHSYTYDNQNRITSDNTKTYSYDSNGNVEYVGNTRFYYDYKNRLTAVGSFNVSYPSAGNIYLPKEYKNFKYFYEGKRLIRVIKELDDETITVCYFYNELGLMVERIETHVYSGDEDDDVYTSKYYYDEEDRLITTTWNNERFDFLYNENGIYGYSYNIINRYYYIKDVLGTIIGVVNESGSLVKKFDYDAYGNIINSTINMFDYILYKGYYYDYITEMYYLKSRFYKPEWHRFLTPDSLEYLDIYDLNGINLYTYCNNNPVMYFDPKGHMPKWLISILKGLSSESGTFGLLSHDLYEIFGKNVTAEVNEQTHEVKINNSHEIKTFWVQLGYSFYVKYINPETRGHISGSIFGIQLEWLCHNIAYNYYDRIGDEGKMEQAASVDLGKTIFSDNHGDLSDAMKLLYFILEPFLAIIDIIKNGGWR